MANVVERLSSELVPLMLAGMQVNFEIALIALVLGLAVGLLLAAARLCGGLAGAAAAALVALMRAAPTFVVMFFLLNAIPRNVALLGHTFVMSGVMTVALSLVPYSAAYVADAGMEALKELRLGSTLGALLFLPNVTRAFFVLVMSSSTAAAIGVTEGITVLLRQAEHMPTPGAKLACFAVGILLFGIPLQAGFRCMSLIQRALGRMMMMRAEPR